MSIQQFPASDGRFNPTEVLTDPVNKLRTSTAQALIDTDFEYGTQQSKWENLAVTNNRPFAAPSATAIPNVTAITMSTNADADNKTLSASHFEIPYKFSHEEGSYSFIK